MKFATFSLVLFLCWTAAALAEEPREAIGYDRAREVTVQGTVVELRNAARTGTPRGTYLVLRTPTETLDIHLGSRIGARQGRSAPAAGDAVEVVGCFVRLGDSPILLAREVRKGGATLTFRNERGLPSALRRPAP